MMSPIEVASPLRLTLCLALRLAGCAGGGARVGPLGRRAGFLELLEAELVVFLHLAHLVLHLQNLEVELLELAVELADLLLELLHARVAGLRELDVARLRAARAGLPHLVLRHALVEIGEPGLDEA